MKATLYVPPGTTVEIIDREPAPDPDPTNPTIGTLQARPLTDRQIWFRAMHNGSRYTRAIANTLLPRAAGVKIDIAVDNPADQWYSDSYTITCDGQPVGTLPKPAGKYGSCIVDLSAIDPGWHVFDVSPSSPASGETPIPYWMHVGDAQPQTWAPAQHGSFDLVHGAKMARWGKVPATLDAGVQATGYPLAPRQWVPMTGHPDLKLMFRRDLVPGINGDPPYLHTLPGGQRTCLCTHAYAWASLVDRLPRIVLRDGPRGVGTVAGATHLQIGRRGGIYGLDSWRMFHVDPDGRVRTLLGWRHGDAGLEMVGDWSTIPAERHGLHEAWGGTWDLRTVAESALDTSLLLDRGDGTMEHPHTVGPTFFIADSQHNRVLRAQFSPRDHAAPPVVTEFLTGLADPWDVVYHGGRIYVSERLAHRIAAYDATTGAYVETVVQGPAWSGVDKNRMVTVSGTLEQRRAALCVGPEGLYVLGDWLYYGSRASQRVKRIHLVSRVIEDVCDPYFDLSAGGSQYCKISVRSDGTVFASSWESGMKSGPRAHKPDGSVWAYQSGASSALKGGRGGNYADIGYSTASAVDDYRIVYSGADYGLVELSLAVPADPPAWDKNLYAAGRVEYEAAGYRLTHGVDGYGQWGYPLPWGASAAMAYYLTCHGHAP